VNLIATATALLATREWGGSLFFYTLLTDAVTLAVAMFLAKNDEVDSVVLVADGE
jgi:hypothetical protein